jgi:quinol monooxygenase YgiN
MAIWKSARYRIRPESDEAVTAAIREFVAEVRRNEPETRYEAWRVGEGVDFLHLMRFADAEAEERHRVAPYTTRFVEILYPACESAPVFEDLEPIL